jgi:DNA-binding response OmpR family regulator
MKQHREIGTLLLVDDHLPLLRNLAFLLEISGFHTMTASNGAEALELLEREQPDLIISDIDMPIMNGYELLADLRSSARPQIPVILMSARYTLEDVLYSLDLGADDYIPKPFDIGDVLDAIERCAPQLMPQDQKVAS